MDGRVFARKGHVSDSCMAMGRPCIVTVGAEVLVVASIVVVTDLTPGRIGPSVF